MKLFYIMSIMLALSSLPATTFSQYLWKLEQADKFPLKASSGNITLKHTSNWKDVEFVKGIKGTGIRTDGYSTWLTAAFPSTLKQPFSLSGWFALESFPTDTAAFFVLVNDQNQTAISACVDRFGSVLIGKKDDGQFTYFNSSLKLERFKWTHVALQLTAGKIDLMVNGVLKQSVNPGRKWLG